MVEALQPPQDLLRTAADEINDMGGTKKTMPENLADDFPVAPGQLDRRDRRDTFEAGKTDRSHRFILPWSLNSPRLATSLRVVWWRWRGPETGLEEKLREHPR